MRNANIKTLVNNKSTNNPALDISHILSVLHPLHPLHHMKWICFLDTILPSHSCTRELNLPHIHKFLVTNTHWGKKILQS